MQAEGRLRKRETTHEKQKVIFMIFPPLSGHDRAHSGDRPGQPVINSWNSTRTLNAATHAAMNHDSHGVQSSIL